MTTDTPATAKSVTKVVVVSGAVLATSAYLYYLWSTRPLPNEGASCCVDEDGDGDGDGESCECGSESCTTTTTGMPELEDLDLSAEVTPAASTTMRSRKAEVMRKTVERGSVVGSGDGNLPGAGQKIFFKTFGCSHNTSDSEYMMGLLSRYGYDFVGKIADADVVVLNSCTVKNPSEDALATLVKAAEAEGLPTVVCGCVPQADRKSRALRNASLVGTSQIDRIVEVVEETLRGNRVSLLQSKKLPELRELPKIRRNPLVEIVAVNTGCLGKCSYCKTKYARGSLGSYSKEDIIARVRTALAEGVQQIWLTSEDLGAYGLDIGTNVAELLREIVGELEKYPDSMMRLGMTNPPYILQHAEEVAKILTHPQVFEFIHIPIQSGSNDVLRHMIREYTVEDFDRLVGILRARVPNLTVATDVICGFPTESEENHRETLELIKRHRFPVINISQFYARPGTAAARIRPRLPGKVIKERSTEVTNLFMSYSLTDSLYDIGEVVEVWYDEVDEGRGQTVGHTKRYTKAVLLGIHKGVLGKKMRARVEDNSSKWHVVVSLVE
ncbi:2-methylthioadenine synthetase, putative [Perkinsus marinus ATCC 50983]|uniref:Threonylcarbamoyladenosine tRNA methylthiotransferase n=1 Tax=Perkinsus marinus (strain ATCC 50983 / TXsc) TaxID=423536 RepID=C5L3Y5_PERM5|nr:2-methylthioadenine synthetase, putative [Perkinsus marinus ATCC 50983]EER08714.1 2-methylthioadenine synthetase, putative [Perkinsus marinus ATCC 50983]|eukprot:XP_002776898.1 2-methylthioadenine synthetase, putative [Perkinsus marinus ATCC 50983]